MVSKAENANFTWKYDQAPRATAVSNDQMDLYKDRIREMYLDLNLSRKEVTRRLKDIYGFSISPDQFSKATNRWKFQKQPRRQSQSTVASAGALNSPMPQDQQLPPIPSEIPLSGRPQFHADANKRPRSTESPLEEAVSNHSNASSLLHDRPSKRYRPTAWDFPNQFTEPIQDAESDLFMDETDSSSDAFAFSILGSNRMSTSPPFTLTTLDPLDASERADSPDSSLYSSIDIDKVCAEFLDSCYIFKRAFCRYAKSSVPFQSKTSSNKERRSRMLDMARTARSKDTRKVACVMLESELKSSNDPLDLSGGNKTDQPAKEEMAPHESFLFHKYLARIYSYQYNKAGEVQEHLDKARNFMDIYAQADPSQNSSLDLWTVQQLSEGREEISVPENLLSLLSGTLSMVIGPCLAWCKKRLHQMNEATSDPSLLRDIRNGAWDAASLSQWGFKWNDVALWAHGSHLFAYLWHDLQVHPPAIEDVLVWLNEEFLAGISPTHFLMIICKMIIEEARFFVPSPRDSRRSSEEAEFHPSVQNDKPSFDVPSCIRAIEKITHENEDSARVTSDEFVQQFCKHHSWATPMRRKNKFVQQIQAELLDRLESTTQLMVSSRVETPTPPTPKTTTEWWGEVLDTDMISLTDLRGDSMSDFEQTLESMMKRTTISMSEGIPSVLIDIPSERTSSIASGSTASFHAHQIFFNALQGNPPFTKSMIARSSCSSDTSRTSSLHRFRAAGSLIRKIPSLLRRSRSSAGSSIELFADWDGDMAQTLPMGAASGFGEEIIVEEEI